MSDLIVEVCKITSVEKILDSDFLDLITIKGWQLVSQTKQFIVDELVIYLPVDSLIPMELADKLGITKYLKGSPTVIDNTEYAGRIYPARIRGIPSYGVVMKIPAEFSYLQEGQDVKELLKIRKWEPPPVVWDMGPKGKGPKAPCLPELTWFPKYTDIQNIKNFKDVFQDGEEVVINEKVHGANSRIGYLPNTAAAGGCVLPVTKVYDKEGMEQRISSIKKGDIILGVHNGYVSHAIVERVYKNGLTHRWYELHFTRRRENKNHKGTIQRWGNRIICTKNHRFWCPKLEKYKTTLELEEGDEVLTLDHEFKPNRGDQTSPQYFIKRVDVSTSTQKGRERWDLETSTHNYFANRLLVHNSNENNENSCGIFVAGSHNVRKQEMKGAAEGEKTNSEGICLYWEPYRLYPQLKEMMRNAFGGASVVVYGEIYGYIQSLRYGKGKGQYDYLIFDIKVDNKFLDYDDFVKVCQAYQLPTAPLLYRGPYSYDIVRQHTQGNTTIVDMQQIREGCVVKSSCERHAPALAKYGGRAILKSISDDYLLMKNRTDYH